MLHRPAILRIGKGAIIECSKVLAIIDASKPSVPLVKYRQQMIEVGRAVNVTKGRAVKSFVITDTNHLFLCSVKSETLFDKFGDNDDDE